MLVQGRETIRDIASARWLGLRPSRRSDALRSDFALSVAPMCAIILPRMKSAGAAARVEFNRALDMLEGCLRFIVLERLLGADYQQLRPLGVGQIQAAEPDERSQRSRERGHGKPARAGASCRRCDALCQGKYLG